jgi:hypothetical protein
MSGLRERLASLVSRFMASVYTHLREEEGPPPPRPSRGPATRLRGAPLNWGRLGLP